MHQYKVDDGRLVIQARLITPLDEPESSSGENATIHHKSIKINADTLCR